MVEECGAKMNGEQELIAKYKHKLSAQLDLQASAGRSQLYSLEYQIFRKEILPPHMTGYEKLCNFCEKLLKMKIKPEKAALVQELLDTAHLQTTPAGGQAACVVV